MIIYFSFPHLALLYLYYVVPIVGNIKPGWQFYNQPNHKVEKITKTNEAIIFTFYTA